MHGREMVGRRLAHYKIVERLGRGGMGEVYLAEDTSLHRKVALKALPAGLTADPAWRERFGREARATAALNHPNIVTIHSIEEADGIHFLTMEYVDGRTLADLILPGGLSSKQLLDIAIPLADALAAAHEKGIVHRDLKPGNIMLTAGGRLKVLDFGLAKLQPVIAPRLAGATTAGLTVGPATEEGQILGTLHYMSPEQVEARPLDGRSDLFSFGVVLYELATGARPFCGDSPASLISSILRDAPRPLEAERPDLPATVGQVVSRCLTKDPRNRYQSAREVARAFEDVRKAGESQAAAVVPPVASTAPSQAPSTAPS